MMEKQKSKIFPCGKCEQCLVKDCSFCVPCLDKKKFGGKNRLRKKCVLKICPIQEKLKQEQQALKDAEIVLHPIKGPKLHNEMTKLHSCLEQESPYLRHEAISTKTLIIVRLSGF